MKTNQNSSGRTGFGGLNRTTRAGTYTVVMSLLLLVALVVVNLIVGALPSRLTKLDTSAARLFTLSATTEQYVKRLDEDITITVLCEGGKLSTTMSTFLDRYVALNRHIRVQTVDPVADPTALEAWSGASSLSNNSLIVESARRYTLVGYDNLDFYYVEGAGSIGASAYTELIANESYVQYYAYYYGIDLTNAIHYFGGEQTVTSALEYVTAETVPHLYVLTGEGEEPLGSTFESLMKQTNLSYETLNLGTATEIPASAGTILINAPERDLSDSVTAMLTAYLEKGGHLILITSPDNAAMPNLTGLAAAFGVHAEEGMLYEGNANRYKDYPHVLLPAVSSSHSVTKALSGYGYAMLTPEAHRLTIDEKLPENVSATALFQTSDSAYVKDAEGTETEVGAVNIGVAAENSKTGAQLVWFASAAAFTDATAQTYGAAPAYYLTMAVSWENQTFTSALGAIEAVDMTEGALTVSSAGMLIWTILLVGVIPVGAVASGIVIWARRRKR